MPVATSIKSYTTGSVPKQGVPMIQVYIHKHLDTKRYLISDSSDKAVLVADKETHAAVLKSKVL